MITNTNTAAAKAGETAAADAGRADWQRRLGRMIVLGGAVGRRDLVSAAGRSLLGLPVEAGRSALDLWHRQATALAEALARTDFPVHVLVNAKAPMPHWGGGGTAARLTVMQDPSAYRGTGGLLRDMLANEKDDELALVVAGGQLMLEPLEAVVQQLATCEADVSMVAHRDGSPVSLMLVRCGALRSLKASGFIDLKEQALPILAEHHEVRVLERDHPVAASIRTRRDYIRALSLYHSPERQDRESPFAERWQTTFAIVEDGATVHPTAKIHDSVVLRGATVGPNAVVAHSVLCSGATIRAGGSVVEELVGTENGRRKEGIPS